MPEHIEHNCGLAVTHSLDDAYGFIKALQHRGREAAGIAAISDQSIDAIKWVGTVDRFDINSLHQILSKDYHTFLSHVRYATTGRKDKILDDAHPHVIGGEVQKYSTHVIIQNCLLAAVHNGQINEVYLTDVPKDKLTTGCDTEKLLYFYKEKGPYEVLKNIPGAYTVAIAEKNQKAVLVLRDKHGIRPGLLGKKNGKYCVASEDVAFKKNNGEVVENLDPGSIYYLYSDGTYKKENVQKPTLSQCFFEWNYLAHKNSVINNVSVRKLRELMGQKLADEFNPNDADIVTFVPSCPDIAAIAYAKKTNKTFKQVFYKIKTERSFQGSTADERKQSIETNLYLLPDVKKILQGKKIIVIDDSIVRGNVIKRAVNLLKEEGVSDIYFASYTPQIGIVGKDGIPRGCLFGVDMPPNDSFIARDKTLEEISKELGAKVVYLSLESMLEAYKEVGITSNNLCIFCIGGKHPFE